MNELFILFLIFSFLFLLENKNINKLGNYVGLVIIFSISLSLINLSYFSFILLLVQISALSILFGFIIMLYIPRKEKLNFISNNNNFNVKLSSSDSTKTSNYLKSLMNWGAILIMFILILINFNYINFNSFQTYSFKEIVNLLILFLNYFFKAENSSLTDEILNTDLFIIPNLSLLLFKEYLLNLFIITLLLFFAIVALFFVVKIA